MEYDIFISYKRISLPTANNLYYRLTTKGYSTFFDLEEMRRDNFDSQLLQYIDNAKDVFVILEEGSLDACKKEDWRDDWFCHEIAYSLEKKKNIIPILLKGYKMPEQKNLPDELKELTLKNAPEFSFSFFDEYIEKLIAKEYITSKAVLKNAETSIFKFYSNENCQVFKDGKLVCSIEGNSDEPFFLPVIRKGSYRFKCINSITLEEKLKKESIDFNEEKEVEIEWSDDSRSTLFSQQELSAVQVIEGDEYIVDLGNITFKMIRVEGGSLMIGATREQIGEADNNEYPEHLISLPTYYISQFPITQNLWEYVMGYNKSQFKDKEKANNFGAATFGVCGAILGYSLPSFGQVIGGMSGHPQYSDIRGHYPAENLTHDEALEFVRKLSKITNLQFSLPTEDEWEYAARGGQKSKGYKYAGGNDIDGIAWNRNNSEGHTHPVGEKQPNELCLYDMSGNVWEWTETLAHSYDYSDEVHNGSIFIRRGGSWWHEPLNCRVSKRYASDKNKKTSGLGLRVVIRL